MSYTTASISTDGTAGFLSNYEVPEFIAKLMHYSELTVRSYNFRGTPATFHVSLNNSSQAIKNLTVFSGAKSLAQLKKEKDELDEIIKSNSDKGEVASLKTALETVKFVAGESSEAYKQVKAQYEAALKKANKKIN